MRLTSTTAKVEEARSEPASWKTRSRPDHQYFNTFIRRLTGTMSGRSSSSSGYRTFAETLKEIPGGFEIAYYFSITGPRPEQNLPRNEAVAHDLGSW
jgi:hypothetical protein